MKFKLGIEAEGIYKGFKTLFVPGFEYEWKDILEKAKEHDVQQIYLGANKTDCITLLNKIKYIPSIVITAEVVPEHIIDIPHCLIDKVRFIVRFESDISVLGKLDMIKIDTGKHCHIVTKGQMITNEINYLDEEL